MHIQIGGSKIWKGSQDRLREQLYVNKNTSSLQYSCFSVAIQIFYQSLKNSTK